PATRLKPGAAITKPAFAGFLWPGSQLNSQSAQADFVTAAPGFNRVAANSRVKEALERLAATLLALQQPDGLCWAKQSYHAQYLEDNCEVYDGLSALAGLERGEYHDAAHATLYEQAAERVKVALLGEMWDAEHG